MRTLGFQMINEGLVLSRAGYRTLLASTGSTVNITWTDNSTTEDGFRIYKSTDGGTTYSLLQSESAGATSASVSAVATDKLKVVAYNEAGESDDSNIITVT